jgi:putative peptidoglycan lipid II flippase
MSPTKMRRTPRDDRPSAPNSEPGRRRTLASAAEALHCAQRMTRLVRAASAISGLTLLSRVLGLWRDTVMAAVLGAGPVSDTFFLAWAMPNLMRRLLGEGALSASFVPAYTAARKSGDEPARELLGAVLGAVLWLLLPLCAAVCGLALWFGSSMQEGDGRLPLLLQLGAILFPYTIPICATALLAGALNTLESFALPAAAPALLNVVWIAALYLAAPLGIGGNEGVVTFLSLALLAGGFLQLALVVWPMRRRAALATPRLAWPAAGSAARGVFVAMLPTVLGMSLGQISTLIDQSMAYGLLGDGANTYLYLGNRLLLFPHALTALAVVVAVFPRLASDAGESDRAAMRATLDRAASAMLFVTIPAAMGLFVLADDVVTALFVRRSFTADDAEATALTTRCLLLGLPFLGLSQLYARAFYAVGDTRTPARIAAWLLLLNVGLNAVLLLGLGLGTEGLALSTSVVAALNAALLARSLRAAVPNAPARAGLWLRNLAATTVMCAAVWAVRPAAAEGRADILLFGVALPIAVGVVVYGIAQRLLRSPELDLVLRRRRRG